MRRSELSRKPKQRRCGWCKESFTPAKMGQEACKPFPCAMELGKHKEAKRREKANREQKRADRKRLEEIKTKPMLTKEAQREFNRYIRLRDHDQPCICCGQWADERWKPGGSYDAGHMRSVGSHPELRFEELNCHKQLKSCNAGEGKYAGKRRTVTQGYKDRLPEKIGQEAFDWLMGPHEPKNYTREELREIRDKYRKMANEMEKQIGRN